MPPNLPIWRGLLGILLCLIAGYLIREWDLLPRPWAKNRLKKIRNDAPQGRNDTMPIQLGEKDIDRKHNNPDNNNPTKQFFHNKPCNALCGCYYNTKFHFNKVCSYVYNTLSRFARRIIDKMRTNRDIWFFIFTGSFGTLASIAIYVVVLGNWSRLKEFGWLLGIAFVITGLIVSYKQLKGMDNKAEDAEGARHKELLTELKGIRKDLEKG